MRYFAPVKIRQTAASLAGVTVWAMRNLGTALVKIKDIYLSTAFDGTVAASMGTYEICRFNTATPTAGTAVTAIPRDSLITRAVQVSDIRYVDTGLTVTGVVFEDPFMLAGVTRQRGPGTTCYKNDPSESGQMSDIILRPGEGLCIRLGAAAVIGDQCHGYISWEETPTVAGPGA